MASIRLISQVLKRRTYSVSGVPILLSSCYRNTNNIIIKKYSSRRPSEISKVDEDDLKNKIRITTADVVKEHTKSAWYFSVIIAGLGVTAFMFFAVLSELFSDKSPNSIYSKAVERCMNDPKVIDALGEPIKAYGEETRRGRRRHVSHLVYMHNDRTYMRMQFYIQGARKRGTVHLEVRENNKGQFVYRYLFIQLEDLLNTVIVLEDNRATEMESNKVEDLAPFNFPVMPSSS
ncbi:mitochondrial import inner membrane translocase subunit Tim21 [Chelonus insularis]|uniref:mitochondrial import inner membrane translocase subunit Tim21 n=1 Tax=Chelonus insularis TaxID=460826 RepID=UPI00158A7003|nr:mitochondrial import inner membrane translocase subunit Tim21 [Chelonus insularis]XP_034945855.1 mitochondrial import inner membrane translocase subunit Tim21 [Chelonus insularis]XP_034945857.1 mitochondrial import inner membrane translocase subunit Tim21 [Chelonus insularis]